MASHDQSLRAREAADGRSRPGHRPGSRGHPLPRGQVGRPAEHYALVVEVVSPSSRKTDRFFKPIEYAAAGVPAYWRVETEPELVIVVPSLIPAVLEASSD